MVTLPNFPMVAQVATVEPDGTPAPDAQQSSLAAALCAGVQFLTGQEVTPDLFQVASLDLSDRGHFVDTCNKQGVELSRYQGMPAYLVAVAHIHLQHEEPVVFFETNPYVSTSLGWLHALVFYGEETGFLTAMDPWTAKPVRRTDEEWGQLLLDNQIWVLEKIVQPPQTQPTAPPAVLDLAMPDVAAVFQTTEDQFIWFCPSTNKHIEYGLLDFYRRFHFENMTALELLGLPRSDAIPLGSGEMKQHFDKAVLLSTDGQISFLNLYDGGPGEDPMIKQLEALMKGQKA